MFEDIKLNTIGNVDFTKGTITLPMKEWEKWETNKRKLAELINYMQDQLKAWDANHNASKHYVFMNNERLILAECDDNSLLEQAIIKAKNDLYEEHKMLEDKIKELDKVSSELRGVKSRLDYVGGGCSYVKNKLVELRSKWYLRPLWNTITDLIEHLHY
jgi:hypothetical protein